MCLFVNFGESEIYFFLRKQLHFTDIPQAVYQTLRSFIPEKKKERKKIYIAS